MSGRARSTSHRVFVRPNAPVPLDALSAYFSRFGSVTDVYAPKSAARLVVFVSYLGPEAVDLVMSTPTHVIEGVPVSVQRATPRASRDSAGSMSPLPSAQGWAGPLDPRGMDASPVPAAEAVLSGIVPPQSSEHAAALQEAAHAALSRSYDVRLVALLPGAVPLVHAVFDTSDPTRVPLLVVGQQIPASRDLVLTVVGITPPPASPSSAASAAGDSSAPQSPISGRSGTTHHQADQATPLPSFSSTSTALREPVAGSSDPRGVADRSSELVRGASGPLRRRSDIIVGRTAMIQEAPGDEQGSAEWRGHASHAELLIAGADRRPGRRTAGRSAVSARTLRSFRHTDDSSQHGSGSYGPGSPREEESTDRTEGSADASVSRAGASERISAASAARDTASGHTASVAAAGAPTSGGIAAGSARGRRAHPQASGGPVVVGILHEGDLAPRPGRPHPPAIAVTTSMMPVPLQSILATAAPPRGVATAARAPPPPSVASSVASSRGRRHPADDATAPDDASSATGRSLGTGDGSDGADRLLRHGVASASASQSPELGPLPGHHPVTVGSATRTSSPESLRSQQAPVPPPRLPHRASVAAQNAAVAAAAAQAAGIAVPGHGLAAADWHGGAPPATPLPPGAHPMHPHAALGAPGHPAHAGHAGRARHHPGALHHVPPSPDVGSCRLFLNGVPAHITEADIRDHFGRFGQVKDVYFPVYHAMVSAGTRGALSSVPTRKRRGFCFVTMAIDADVDTALAYSDRVIAGTRVPEMRRARPRHASAPQPRSHGVTMALGPAGPAGRVVFAGPAGRRPSRHGAPRHADAPGLGSGHDARGFPSAYPADPYHGYAPPPGAGHGFAPHGHHPSHGTGHRVVTSLLPGSLSNQHGFGHPADGRQPQHHAVLAPGSVVILPGGQRGTVWHDGRILAGAPGHAFGGPDGQGAPRGHHGGGYPAESGERVPRPQQRPEEPSPAAAWPEYDLHASAAPLPPGPSGWDAPPASGGGPAAAELAPRAGSALASRNAAPAAYDEAFPAVSGPQDGGGAAAASSALASAEASLSALSLRDDDGAFHPLLGGDARDGVFSSGPVGFSVLDPSIWHAE